MQLDLVRGRPPVLPDLRDAPLQGHLHPLMATVRLASITKHYGPTVAVDELDLEVADGELVTLLGPSGCGKTTTLRMVAGLIEPTDGRIYFDDRRRDVPAAARSGTSASSSRRRRCSRTCRSPTTWRSGCRSRARAKDAIRDRVDGDAGDGRAARATARGCRPSCPAASSSGSPWPGSSRRIPRVLLFDEPLSALDRNLRDTLKYSILDLQRRTGKTAIYVTHDQSEAFAISDRIVVMNAGPGRADRHPDRHLPPAADAVRGRVHRREQRPRGDRRERRAATGGGRAGRRVRGRRPDAADDLAARRGAGSSVGDAVVAYLRPEDVRVLDDGDARPAVAERRRRRRRPGDLRGADGPAPGRGRRPASSAPTSAAAGG